MGEIVKFNIGDWVVHAFHGVGKVEDIVEKNLDGVQKLFYRVSTNEMDYWIPFGGENVDHIEPVRSKKDFSQALRILSSIPEPLTDHHKARSKFIQDCWQEGSLKARATLLRDLNGRLKTQKLNFNEKEMMEKIIQFLISEWIVVDPELTRRQVKKKILYALKESVKRSLDLN